MQEAGKVSTGWRHCAHCGKGFRVPKNERRKKEYCKSSHAVSAFHKRAAAALRLVRQQGTQI